MRLALLLAVCAWTAVSASEPTPEAQREIAHLLTHVASSQCEYFRNGSWHSADRAARHIERKYEAVLKRGLISTTESFIEYAASRSSVSGRAYLVRCVDAEAVESAAWLTTELLRYRLPQP